MTHAGGVCIPKAFHTHETSGGAVINVAGNYTAYGSDEAEIVAKIKQSSTLDKLPYAEGASWNSDLACLTGTRVALLSLVHRWSRSCDNCRIFCLQGVAGSGKTAVSNAVARFLSEAGLLASCFFFDRADASRNTPRLLFSTMARDIAALYPAIAEDIAAKLDQEPSLASANLSRQFEAFIAGPLRRHPVDRQIVVVIDALDEATDVDLGTDLLALLRDGFAKLPPYFRVLITSRPTRILEHHLSGKSHVVHHHIDINSDENRRDIAAYIDDQLQNSRMFSSVDTHGPDGELIRDLRVIADGLFIWIATVFRYLGPVSNPKKKLRALLSRSHAQGQEPEPIRKIDALYSTILEDSGDWDDEDFRAEYALFMGSVMAIKRPLSLAALRALHGGNQELSLGRLPQRFGAVLVGLHNENKPIHTLHLSFREFITSRAAGRAETRKFFLSEKEHSRTLAELCIQTMVRELTDAPIAGTGYLATDEYDGPGIPELTGVSEQLLYGCEHWDDHLCDIESPTLSFTEILGEFLPKYNTTWIEIVASTSTFAGSLPAWRWLHAHATELKELYNEEAQAASLFRLSTRLGYSGRLEEALAAIEDSVHLRRALVAQQPTTFDADLALSLDSLSVHLSYLGRNAEAFASNQEAVGLHRDRALVAERPAACNANLALSLSNLSNHFSDHGRHAEALAAIQEAVGLRRALAAEQPAAFNAVLAASLNNLSNRLADHGRHEEALAAIQEAVGLRRALAVERPEAFNAGLALSLNNLSADLSDHGRHDEALAANREAVGLRRALAAERPEAFNAVLASSLHNLSIHLLNQGRHEEALAAIQEAVGLRRALAAERPAAFNADLAQSLYNLSLRFSRLGHHEEAQEAGQEAVSLYRALAAERPKVFTSKLSNALWQLSLCLSASGREAEAKVAWEEAQSLRL
ncbi:hypothetical protein HWV62_35628 [Athelia sp. TMB]|nr:hypothetical protein HWV62_35628 [Athelia sp. TMB]